MTQGATAVEAERMSGGGIAWRPHPDHQLEQVFASSPGDQLKQWLRHPKVVGDPYARLRLFDRLRRCSPDDQALQLAWMQAMLLGNRPAPVWEAIQLGDGAIERTLLPAQVAQVMGETQEARARYQRLLQVHPQSVDVWQKYLEFEQPEHRPPTTGDMLERLADSARSAYDREKIAFTQARFFMDSEPRRAFAEATRAHRLKRLRTGAWNGRAVAERLDRDRQWRPSPGPAGAGSNPVFVVGLPRSGTTLISSILAGHSAVAAVGEQNLVPALAGGPCRSPPTHPDSRLSAFSAAWYRAATGDLAGDAAVTVDKLPANAEHCGLILALFPDAVIVEMERSLPDCASSIHFHDFEFGCDYANDPADIRRYADMISSHLAHWRAAAPERVLKVSFESLVGAPEHTLQPVLAALALAWEPQMLDFWRRKDGVGTYSERQVRQPINTKGIGVARRYLPESSAFLDALSMPARFEAAGLGCDG